MEPVIEPLLHQEAATARRRGCGLEDLRDRLPGLFAAMDGAVLIQTLRRRGFSAALSGRAEFGDNAASWFLARFRIAL